LAATGVVPDIEVAVSGEAEKVYFADEFKVLSGQMARLKATNNVAQSGSTNRTSRRRLNEAELVRMLREGVNPDEPETADASTPKTEEDSSVVRDPALARALDLLKGIAIVGRSLPR